MGCSNTKQYVPPTTEPKPGSTGVTPRQENTEAAGKTVVSVSAGGAPAGTTPAPAPPKMSSSGKPPAAPGPAPAVSLDATALKKLAADRSSASKLNAMDDQFKRSVKALNEKTLSQAGDRLKSVHSIVDFQEEFHNRELAAAALKRERAADWLPEYRPVSIVPPEKTADTVLDRVTRASPALILKSMPVARKTKIVCTLGPACWSEEGIAKLLDAGMNVARFNFSHGAHADHQAVLDRLKKVAAEKKSHVAFLLDTKGPEVRTAMLRGGKDIELEAGQDIIVAGVGDEYTTWEGYKDEETGETKIGLSYGRLCQSVKPGNTILIADGAISIEVVEIMSDTELKGKVVNSFKLGQRKNCNLPGVHVDLPVLSPKDIDDVQNFAVKNDMDFIAASFVQCADDIKMIRRVLDEVGGQKVKIIAKIENEAGLRNINSIIQETDGIMVARGDLAMEVPCEKIALAQKMIIAKCNIAGKIVITATQMLESMVENPLPTRAEMTDVANAVFDGTDAVMLSGETANGKWPDTAVGIMKAIAETAECAVDSFAQYDFIRVHALNQSSLSVNEATLSGVSKMASMFGMDKNRDGVLDASEACIAVVLTKTGAAAKLVSKYKPPCPVIVVSEEEKVLRQCSLQYGLYPCKVQGVTDPVQAVIRALAFGVEKGLAYDGNHIIVAFSSKDLWADENPEITVDRPGFASMRGGSMTRTASQAPEHPAGAYTSPFLSNAMTCMQTVRISPDLIINKQFNHRKSKIIATVGPSCWSKDMLKKLAIKGVSIFRFVVGVEHVDFYQNLLNTYHQAMRELEDSDEVLFTPRPAVMFSIKGQEIRTTLNKDRKPIELKPGMDVVLSMTQDVHFMSGMDEATGMIKIGTTYKDLMKSVKPNDTIMITDGIIKLTMVKHLNDHEVLCKVVSGKKLGEHQIIDLPNKRINANFLSESDKGSLAFAAQNHVDLVTLPFVQCAEDIIYARKVLDDAGGARIKIIAQIDSPQAIQNFDAILEVAAGIMISRGHLGLRIPAEKVCVAQKWMITKANLAGKPVCVASQLMHTMVEAPRPTRAEMTDVANAIYDGADAIVLRAETSTGHFVERVVETVHCIMRDAEVGVDHYSLFNFVRNYTPKPLPTLACLAASAVKASIDMEAILFCVVTNTSAPLKAVSKFRPGIPIVVATTKPHVAGQSNILHGCIPLLLPSTNLTLDQITERVVEFARKQHLAAFQKGDNESDQLIMLSGPSHRLFTTEEDLAEMEFVTVVIGDESSNFHRSHTIHQVGYVGEDTISYRSTKVGLDLVCDPIETPRKTKILCTLGPKCWSEEGISKLLDCGMNVARFNFSHGSHQDHQVVLDRVRKVAQDKGMPLALMLDTKGPEVRTAMLRNHEPIQLEAGQDIFIEAVGEKYVEYEGYKDENETRIGLSYPYLCQDVKVGGRILIGDGTIVVEVQEIISDTVLRGKVLNSKKLGERKNCNLPGVKVRLPVLMPKDIDDVQNFAVKNKMDFIAASFVQTADDVKFIREKLDEVGGQGIKIISKIESSCGLEHYDEILKETDGIMVARGDLAMEIPSEKVALAQKMMITKANIAGKFIVTATQMLESMIENPLPTRAEMTDVANAVFDGTDAVMLSGETANGAFPDKAVSTMAAIVANAEVGINYYQVYDFIRDFSPKPASSYEAVLSCAASDIIDLDGTLIIVVTTTGAAARMVSKYRPKCPVLVVTPSDEVARQCSPVFGCYPHVVKDFPEVRSDVEFEIMLEKCIISAIERGLCQPGGEVVVVHGTRAADAEQQPMVNIKVAPGVAMPYMTTKNRDKTLSLRATAISLRDLLDYSTPPRKTKIVCTLGPACHSEEGLAKLMQAGMNVARFNFSHGTHESHQEVLDRLRMVAESQGMRIATLLDTKGPEIRTAMVKDGKNLELQAGQEVILEAVGASYDKWEGYIDESTGVAYVGISYDKLCQSVKPGNRILIADGSLSIEVVEILNDSQLRGKCMNAKSLGPRKNCNLPGVKVDIPVLTSKDIGDLQQFCVRNEMDFVAASFVQTADDIRFIRRVLAEAGGLSVKIIAKIENEAGLEHFDAILAEADGIMVARGDLAMEIPSEKVALAQKMMITKSNIAGKFIITATQMLESMCSNPLPTRAEMTDVANAIFDGTDAVMLSGETANGKFPDTAVATMAAIARNAENASGYLATQAFIRDHSARPFTRGEAMGAAVCAAIVDCNAQLVIVISEDGFASRMVSKYRPAVPQIVVTDDEHLANQTCAGFGMFALKVDFLTDVESLVAAAKAFAISQNLWSGEPGVGVVLSGKSEPAADNQPVMRIITLAKEGEGQSGEQGRRFSMHV